MVLRGAFEAKLGAGAATVGMAASPLGVAAALQILSILLCLVDVPETSDPKVLVDAVLAPRSGGTLTSSTAATGGGLASKS